MEGLRGGERGREGGKGGYLGWRADMVGWVGVLVDGGEGEVRFEVELGGLAAVIGGSDRRVRSLGAGSGDFGGLNYRMVNGWTSAGQVEEVTASFAWDGMSRRRVGLWNG